MKITILTLGSRGDVQPYVALGKALKTRGHDVTLGCPDNFEQFVTHQNLKFHPIGVDMQALLQSPEIKQVMDGNYFKLIKIWRKKIVPMTRKSLDETWAAARDAEIIIYHPKIIGAPDVAEVTNAKLISASPVPMYPTKDFPLLIWTGNYGAWLNKLSYKVMNISRYSYLSTINTWRKDVLGLGKGPAFTPLGAYKGGIATRICLVSPSVLQRPEDWDKDIHMTGYCFLDEDTNWQPPEDLSNFLRKGPPPIYIGFGSMTTNNPLKLGQTIIKALKITGHRAILAKGWGALEDIETPDTIHMIDSAPHSALFQHVTAVVHHGGAGTTAAGIRAGLPTLICPVSVDQPFWGKQIWKLGCGPKPQPLKKLSAENFAKGLDDLMTNQSYRQRAEEISKAINAEDGIANAIKVIEGLENNNA